METTSRISRASSCSTLSTGIAAIVVQFGLAMMPLIGRRAAHVPVEVDLADHQRHVGVLAPGRRVVDHDDPGRGEPRRLHPRHRRARGEQGDVEAGRVGGRGVLDLDLLAAERQLRPAERAEAKNRTAGRGEVALLEQLAHDLADLAGGADHSDRRPLPSAPSPRTRRPRLVAAEPERLVQRGDGLVELVSLISTEIRISDVEIRSMLTPTSASASQNVAVTPGWVRMPGADQRHLADVIVVKHPGEADSACSAVSSSTAPGRSRAST